MLEVVHAWRILLAPPNGDYTVDDSGMPPYEPQKNTVYAWEEGPTPQLPFETGPGYRENFAIVVLYVLDGAGEEPMLQHSRDVSEALDLKRREWSKIVRDNPSMTVDDQVLWTYAYPEGVPAFLQQLSVRGVAVRVRGYRLVTEAEGA